MTLTEFAALKVGDAIENIFSGSRGEVTTVTEGGVRVRWPPSNIDFAYPVNSTAWMSWSKVGTS